MALVLSRTRGVINRVRKYPQKSGCKLSALGKAISNYKFLPTDGFKLFKRKSGSNDGDKNDRATHGEQLAGEFTESWAQTRAISDDALCAIALADRQQFWPLVDGPVGAKKARTAEGSNNAVHFVEFSDGKKVCIRIPACGHSGSWTSHDETALRNQALYLKYLKRNTRLPVPEVLVCGPNLQNDLRTPYMITTVLEGKDVHTVWHEGTDGILLDDLRLRILKNLASAMAELRHLKYPKAGNFYFEKEEDEPTIGRNWVLNAGSQRSIQDASEYLLDAYDNSEAEFRKAFEAWKLERLQTPPARGSTVEEWRGIVELYELLLAHFPFEAAKNEAGEEHYVVAPPDFDWQNILVDPEGNITGLIDWDRLETVPRFIGWACVPLWLGQDWQADYLWPGSDRLTGYQTSPPDELDRYRQAYTGYIKEACGGKGDTIFTSKSHLYSAMLMTIGSEDSGDLRELMEKILAAVLPRVKVRKFCEKLGEHGWAPEQKEYMARKFKDFLAPDAEQD